MLRRLGGNGSNAGIGFHALMARGGPGDGGIDLSGLWVNPSVAYAGANRPASEPNSGPTTVVKLQAATPTAAITTGPTLKSASATTQSIRTSALNVLVQCKNLSLPVSSSTIRELVGTYFLATTSTSGYYRGLSPSFLQIDKGPFPNPVVDSCDAMPQYAAATTMATVVVPTAALPTIMLLMSHTGLTREAEALLRGAAVPLVFLRVPRPELLLDRSGGVNREFDPRAYRLASGAIDAIVNGPARRLLEACGAGFVTPRALIGKETI